MNAEKKAARAAAKAAAKIAAQIASDEAAILAAEAANAAAQPEAPVEQTATPEAATPGKYDHLTRSVVPLRYKRAYRPFADTCGDALTVALSLMLQPEGKKQPIDLGALQRLADENGIDLARWAGKNNGMLRMNIGNVLRNRVKRHEAVTVDGTAIS